MGDYLRLLTVSDRVIPLADLQRAASAGAVWSEDQPGTSGNYLALGATANDIANLWATVERNPVAPNSLGAEEVAEFIDGLEAGGPPSAARWLSDYLESVRAIYAIRIYPDAMGDNPDALQAVFAIRTAIRNAVGGIGQWDDLGFTNEADRLIWCNPATKPTGQSAAAMLDETTGEWIDFDLNLDDPEDLDAFLRGQLPQGSRRRNG